MLPVRQGMVDVLVELKRLHERVLGRAVAGSEPVFLTPEAARWMRATNNAIRMFNRILVRAKIALVDAEGWKVDIHSRRQTIGSLLARNGVGFVRVQRLMGHSDPKLTAQVYTHLDVEDLRRAVKAV